MTTEKQQLGSAGEDIAANFYLSQKYTILERNWRYGHLEVDIIAQNADCVVFCEVKTRSSAKVATPESSVTSQKQRNLIKAANCYMVAKRISKEVRFDIISIITRGDSHTMEHIGNAFTARW